MYRQLAACYFERVLETDQLALIVAEKIMYLDGQVGPLHVCRK